jgi:hypothetical protein
LTALTFHGSDIIDTEPSGGDFYKMIMGSIDESMDSKLSGATLPSRITSPQSPHNGRPDLAGELNHGPTPYTPIIRQRSFPYSPGQVPRNFPIVDPTSIPLGCTQNGHGRSHSTLGDYYNHSTGTTTTLSHPHESRPTGHTPFQLAHAEYGNETENIRRHSEGNNPSPSVEHNDYYH